MYQKKRMKVLLYFLSFLIPVMIWVIVCAFQGMYPFGNKSIMTGDITYQFIDYLSYYKSIILGNNDFTYTFSKTIGGDMIGFSAYYLFSPFNLLLIFCPEKMLPFGLLIMIIFKCGLLGVCFEHMLIKLYGVRGESVIYSVSYALMGYVIVYFQLYAYFDNLMLLPFIVIGIHNIVYDSKRKLTYIVSLCLSIIINFYIGWMLCIFSLIYFVYLEVLKTEQIKMIKNEKSNIISFIISSVIAAGLSVCILLPSLLSLRGEKNSFHIGFYRTFQMTDLFSRFYTNSFKGNISSCLPNIYCGILMVFLLLLFFFNKNINKKEKIVSFLILLFFIVNFYINTFNVIWHGFNQPIGFPYRYSFLFVFFILLFSYKGFLKLDTKLIMPGIIFIVLFIMYSLLIIIKGSDVIGKKEILLAGCFVALYFILFLLYQKNILKYHAFVVLIIAIQLCDLSINAFDAFHYFDFADMNEYQNYIETVGNLVNKIESEDDSFYRLEKYFRRSHNDSMQFQYNGLSHYSSCEKKEIIDYMGSLGFRNNGNWSFYNSGSTAFVDSLFGIKYVISQYDTTGKPFKYFYKSEDEEYYIYKNPYALPLVFASSEKITEVNTGSNPFAEQNEIADSINGKSNQIFKEANITNINIVNLEQTDDITYYKKDESKEAYIEYEIQVDNKNILETYFTAPDLQNVHIYLNDEDMGPYFDKYKWDIMDFGKWKIGDTLSIRIIPLENQFKLQNAYFYYEQKDNLFNWYNDVIKNECSLEKITSSHLIGKVNAANDTSQIVFSFPYEKSWIVKVDGIKTKTEPAAGQLLSVNIKKGTHSIELKYEPAGKKPGFAISFIFLLLLMVVIKRDKYYILWLKKKSKKIDKIN